MMLHLLKLEVLLYNVYCNNYPSGSAYRQPQTISLLLSFLIPAEDGEVTPEQSYPGQEKNCTLNPEYSPENIKNIN